MKKIMLIAMLVILAGCDPKADQDNKYVKGSHIPMLVDTFVAVWIDAETGCQYLHRQDLHAGITPRLGDNGKPICGIKHE